MTENGDIFNLNATARALHFNDIAESVRFETAAENNALTHTYRNPDPQHPVQSIRHNVAFSNWQNQGLSRIQKSVRIVFQPQFCPDITQLQNQFGRQFHASEQLGPPSLQTGNDNVRRGVAYTMHHIHTHRHIIALEQGGCEWVVSGEAPFQSSAAFR